MGAVTYESVLSNVSRLNREKEPSRPIYFTAGVLGLLSGINTYWLLSGVASDTRVAGSLLWAVLAVVIVACVQLAVLVCVGVAAQACLTKVHTRHATPFNLFQDGALFLGLILAFTFVPLYVYRHLEPLNLHRFWEISFALGPTLTFVGGLMMMALRNNREHLYRKARGAAATANYDGMPIAALRTHIQFQNWMAIIIAAFTVVGLANAVQDIKELRSTLTLPVESPEWLKL
jgi:hypothetical protein